MQLYLNFYCIRLELMILLNTEILEVLFYKSHFNKKKNMTLIWNNSQAFFFLCQQVLLGIHSFLWRSPLPALSPCSPPPPPATPPLFRLCCALFFFSPPLFLGLLSVMLGWQMSASTLSSLANKRWGCAVANQGLLVPFIPSGFVFSFSSQKQNSNRGNE